MTPSDLALLKEIQERWHGGTTYGGNWFVELIHDAHSDIDFLLGLLREMGVGIREKE